MSNSTTYQVNANGNRSFASGSAREVASVAVEWAKQGHAPEAYAIRDDAGGRVATRRVKVTTVSRTAKDLASFGDLMDYETGDHIRPATEAEWQASVSAAESDGGRGVIAVDIDGEQVSCYIEDPDGTPETVYMEEEVILFSSCDDDEPRGECVSDAPREEDLRDETILSPGRYFIALDDTGKSKETSQGPYYLFQYDE